jgi:hypothetical protein
MTFEEPMQTIYDIFNKRIVTFGNYKFKHEINRFFREIETPLGLLKADYDNLKSKHEQVLETNNKLASAIQEQHTLIDDLKHSVAVERDSSCKYARLLATAKEENNQLKEHIKTLEKDLRMELGNNA